MNYFRSAKEKTARKLQKSRKYHEKPQKNAENVQKSDIGSFKREKKMLRALRHLLCFLDYKATLPYK